MSVDVTAIVWQVPLPPTEKIVLLAIADHAWPDGTNAWPSQARIARMCSTTDRTVRTMLKSLVLRGVLIVATPATPRRPATYNVDLAVARRLAAEGGKSFRPGDEGGTTEPARAEQPSAQGGSTFRRTVSEPSGEPPLALTGGPAVAGPLAKAGSARGKMKALAQGEPAFFTEFYDELYPRAVARPDALRAYLKLVKVFGKGEPDLPTELQGRIRAAVQAETQSERWQRSLREDEGEYIPHPSTWLNQHRWNKRVAPAAVARLGVTKGAADVIAATERITRAHA